MEVRVIPWYFLGIPRSPFLGRRKMQPLVHFSIMFWLYTALHYQSNRSSNFLVFHTSGGFSSRPAAFLFLVFVNTTSSYPWVNCLSLIFSWLFIFMIGLSATLGDFLSRFLKCSFHMCIRSSWLAVFSSTLEVFFLLLTSFTAMLYGIVYHLRSF